MECYNTGGHTSGGIIEQKSPLISMPALTSTCGVAAAEQQGAGTYHAAEAQCGERTFLSLSFSAALQFITEEGQQMYLLAEEKD